MGIESTSAGYDEQLNEWQLVRTVTNGKALNAQIIDELKDCMPGPCYTLKTWASLDGKSTKTNQSQITARKRAYWGRAVMLPVCQRTLNSFEGMIWNQEPEVELPTSLEPSAKKLRDVSQMVTQDLLSTGRCGVMVDMPSRIGTKAEALTAYPVFYRPEQIPFWRVDENGNLAEVRLLETYEKQTSEFDWELCDQIRRLVINESGNYQVEVYRDEELYSLVEPIINGKPEKDIQFYFGGADENSPKLSATPMYLLGRMNLAHFRLDADDRDALHYHSQPSLFLKIGDDVDSFMENNGGAVDTGASGVNVIKPDDDAMLLQMEATTALSTKMDADMQNMIACGAQLVKDTGDSTTLGAREMEFSSSTSVIKKVARNQTELMTEVVHSMCRFMGTPEVDYTMKPQFVTDNIDAQILQVAMQYVATLGFPMDVAIEAAKKAGLHDLSTEEMKEKIESQPPVTIPTMTESEALAKIEQEQADTDEDEA